MKKIIALTLVFLIIFSVIPFVPAYAGSYVVEIETDSTKTIKYRSPGIIDSALREECDKIIISEDVILVTSYESFFDEEEYEAKLKAVTEPIMRNPQKNLFSKCGVKEIEVKAEWTVIPEGAFGCCENLTKVTLPNTIKIIEPFAFFFCESLKEVVIPESTEAIGFAAFSACSSLESIIIPSKTKIIGKSAFAMSKSLKNITITNPDTEIDDQAFQYIKNLTIHVPSDWKGDTTESYGAEKVTYVFDADADSLGGSMFSDGNIMIILISAAVLVIAAIAVLVVKKKKH